MSLAVGAGFPVDVPVETSSGPVELSEMLGRGPLVVAFHRTWCPFCQQAARELAAVKDQFDAAGALVVLVYGDDIDTVSASCAERGVPFDCVSDGDRKLAEAAMVRRFSPGRYAAFSPVKLIKALRSGSRVGKVSTKLLEGRATFVIDGAGRVVYARRSVSAADIPPVEEVLAAFRSAAGTGDRRS